MSEARRRQQMLSICGWEAALARLADTVMEVTRQISNSIPRLLGDPYFGLDGAAGFDVRTLDAMPMQGITRKYEFGLEIGTGLGGRARWIAARGGCQMVGTDMSPAFAESAARLNERARMTSQVCFVASSPLHLGFSSESFGHVWIFDAVEDDMLPTTLDEAMRVLRRGGYLTLQVEGGEESASRFSSLLEARGAVEVTVREVTVPAISPTAMNARQRACEAVKKKWPDARVADLLWNGVGTRRRLQVFGRRPA